MADFFGSNNKYFIKSSNINVFPCAYRGYTNAETRQPFDPESRLSTEQSFLRLSNLKHKNSYVVSWDINNNNTSTHKLEFVLGGYYFVIKSIESLAHKFAYIEPVSKNITSTDSTNVLGNLYNDSDVTAGLDKYITDDYYFVGICFTDTEPTGIANNLKIELPETPDAFITHKNRFGLNSSDIKSNYETKAITGNLVSGTSENSIASLYSTVDQEGHALTTNNLNTASGINSIALGESTSATALSSYTEGAYTSVGADYGHAEGYNTHVIVAPSHAYPHAAHAEGRNTRATGIASHAEGGTVGENPAEQAAFTVASGDYSHAEGQITKAQGTASHTEGYDTQASGEYAHAEGNNTYVADNANAGHAEGYLTQVSGNYAHAEGSGKASNARLTAQGTASHAEGYGTYTYAQYSHAEGQETSTGENATASHAEGISTQTGNGANAAHAEGKETKAYGEASHTEGYNTTTRLTIDNTNYDGAYAHAEGKETVASGEGAHAEGQETKAYGTASHAEGYKTVTARNDHPEWGVYAHAEGKESNARGYYSHAEGEGTLAANNAAHAEGYYTEASGTYSHADGNNTIAQRSSQHVFGRYNKRDTAGANANAYGDFVEIVGNGSSGTDAEPDKNRSNARTLDWSGNEKLAGSITVNNKAKMEYDENRQVISFTFLP